MTTVRATTTAAGALASDFENGDTIDGIVLATGDLILIKDQAAGTENGVYTVEAAGAPTRAHPFRSGLGVSGEIVFVTEGTTNTDTSWICLNDVGSDVVGTDALTFEKSTDTPAVSTDGTEVFTNKTIIGATNTVEATGLRTAGAAVTLALSPAPTAADFILSTTSATNATWQQRFQIFHGYTRVNTNINAGFTAIPWTIEVRKDSIYTHGVGSSTVAVGATADYLIMADISVTRSVNNGQVMARLTRQPFLGAITELTGTRAGCHVVNTSMNVTSCSIVWVESLTILDTIRVEAMRQFGTATFVTRTEACRVFIMRL